MPKIYHQNSGPSTITSAGKNRKTSAPSPSPLFDAIEKPAVDVKPPCNNMGVRITELDLHAVPLENRIIIDWLRITFLDIITPEIAAERIGLSWSLFEVRPQGGNGYKSAVAFGGITIMFGGTPQMGVHVNMSGDGCRLYEAQYDHNPWIALFKECQNFNCNFPRLDIAHDNVDETLSLDYLQTAIELHQVRTRFKRGKITQDLTYVDTDLAPIGRTINLSKSRQSSIYPRFYDKAAQLGLVDVHWIRAEIELKADRSKEAIKHLVAGREIGELFFAILNNCFAVINLDDTNKTRCSLASWWAEWLQSTEKLSLTVAKKLKKITDVVTWLAKSVAPSLAMIREHYKPEEALAIMKGLFFSGKSRLKKRHFQILSNSAETCTPLPF